MKIKNISGLTILPSGELCLILNVNDLVKTAHLNFNNEPNEPFMNNSRPTKKEDKNKTTIAKNILVADNSTTVRLMLKNILEKEGYNVFLAKDGIDALSKLSRNNFDIIISDIQMPNMDGIEFLKRLKKEDEYKKIPVIMITSCDEAAYKNKADELGASAYIVKSSFKQEKLLQIVKTYL